MAGNIRYTQVRKAKDNIRKGGTNNPKMRAKYGAANQDQNDLCDRPRRENRLRRGGQRPLHGHRDHDVHRGPGVVPQLHQMLPRPARPHVGTGDRGSARPIRAARPTGAATHQRRGVCGAGLQAVDRVLRVLRNPVPVGEAGQVPEDRREDLPQVDGLGWPHQ